VDVGGQRSERKKWIQCFDNVTAGGCPFPPPPHCPVLFVISLSEFNQVLYEDANTNRMEESLKLFEEILSCIFFQKTPFVVFFNKVDLFREKLKSVQLSDFLPDYTGQNGYDESV
jgi:guanine nucleotide-binding protein subunit alpha